MGKRGYKHTAYWYAKNCGWTHSEAGTLSGQYIDRLRSFPRRRRAPSVYSDPYLDFNPLMLGVCVAMDIGVAMRMEVAKLADPVEREKWRLELMRDLRKVRRPFYYARETERRRALAEERRRIRRRTTTAPCPTPEQVLEAWSRRKDSKEAMIILGGMLQDLECHVDNSLEINEYSRIRGRRPGIRGWLRNMCPELAGHYKTLMRYKAMAVRLRQATGTEDPTPTARLLEEPRHEVVRELLGDVRTTFSSLMEELEFRLDAEMVGMDRRYRELEKQGARGGENYKRKSFVKGAVTAEGIGERVRRRKRGGGGAADAKRKKRMRA